MSLQKQFIIKTNRYKFSGMELLRFILSISVIFLHFADTDKLWWSHLNLVVASFAMISGFFCENINWKRSLRVINIIIVVYACIYVLSLVLLCFSPLINNDYLINTLIFNLFAGGLSWWYIFTIIFIYLLSPWLVKLCDTINKWYSLVLISFMVIIFLGCATAYSINEYFVTYVSVFTFLELATFYYCGLWIKKYMNVNNKRVIVSCLIILIICLLLTEIMNATYRGMIVMDDNLKNLLLKFFSCGYSGGFFTDSNLDGQGSGSFSTILISASLLILFCNIKINNKLFNNLFLYLGQSSLLIYLLHIWIWSIMVNVFGINLNIEWFFIYVLIVIAFSLIFVYPINIVIIFLNKLTFRNVYKQG